MGKQHEKNLVSVWWNEADRFESVHSPTEKTEMISEGIYKSRKTPITYREWCEKEVVAFGLKGTKLRIKARKRMNNGYAIHEIALERV